MGISNSRQPDPDLVNIWRHIPDTPLLSNASGCQQALLYPSIETPEILGDVLNRLAWALAPPLQESFRLLVPTCPGLDLPGLWARLPMPDYELDALRQNPPGRFCRAVTKEELQDSLEAADLVLLWDVSCLREPGIQVKLDRVLVLDPGFYLDVEAVNHARLRHVISSQMEREEYRESAREAFTDIFRRFTGVDDACLFLTGPSLETGLSRPLPRNSLRIICNSLVKNESYLNKIQPDILVFADPAFHYGVSKYAAAFREGAVKALTRYPDCICIIPEKYLPLLLGHFPNELSGRFIGMPEENVGDFNFPDPERFWVHATENILTHLMLPIASTLAPVIHVFGADGRQKQDTGYWHHNPAAQFSGLIQTVYQTHPSFERDRDIEAYYATHCETVDEVIEKGERMVGRHYISETPSLIPALSRRSQRPV